MVLKCRKALLQDTLYHKHISIRLLLFIISWYNTIGLREVLNCSLKRSNYSPKFNNGTEAFICLDACLSLLNKK